MYSEIKLGKFYRGLRLAIITLLLVSTLSFILPVGVAEATPRGYGLVKIVRDNYGVPHIYADTLEGLFFGFGYATAQDRLFQLEINLRTATGTLSEIFGDVYLEFDKATRRDMYPRDELERQFNMLDPEHQAMLRAYAEGINTYVREVLADPPNKLPQEYWILGVLPKSDWTAIDVASIFVGIIGVRFMDIFSYWAELRNRALLDYLTETYGDELGKAIFGDVVWLDDPAAPVTLPSHGSNKPKAGTTQTQLTPKSLEIVLEAMEEVEMIGRVLRELGQPTTMGSNMIVVGPQKSATGNPLLLGGPQFWWTVPSFLHEVGLHGAGFNVVGATPVGFPFVMFGHNDFCAWSSTYGVGDQVDVYVEKLNPENPYQYWFKGRWIDMEKLVETIKVRGGEPVTVIYYRTVHGPVFQLDPEKDEALSRRRAFEGLDLQTLAAWIDSTRARNLEEFREAASKIAYSTNWFYADVEGNIAYFYTGVYPARPEGIDLRLPTPGTGEYEWKAFLPFQANPQDVKKEGYFVQWNNRPAKGWVNNERMFTWGVADRVEILDRMVKALDKISIEDLKEINRKASFMDPNALYLKPLLLEAYDMVRPEDPQIMEAIGYIREWDGLRIDRDGDGLYDSVGQTVFEKWVEILLQNVFADEFGPFSRIVTFKYPEGPYGRSFRPATPGASMLLHAWEGSEATVPPAIDYFNGKDPYDVALAALKKALEELREKYGDRMEEWKREVNIFKFTSKNFARITQSYAEVRDTIYMNRGTENHLVELDAERVKGLIVVPPGQSGFININGVRALHYDDQLDLYENFQYKPTLLYEEDVLMNAELNIALVYPPLMSAKEVASNLKRLAERLEAADAQALKKLEELSQAHGETAEEVGRLASSQEEAAKSLSRLEGEVGGLASKQEELAKSLSQLAAGQREASKAVSELKDMLDKLASEQEKLSGKLEEVAWLAGALQLLAYSAIALAIIAIILSALRSVSRRGFVKAGPAA